MLIFTQWLAKESYMAFSFRELAAEDVAVFIVFKFKVDVATKLAKKENNL